MTDKGSSGKTIANKHGFLASALNAAVGAGHIPTNPASGIRLPRTERPEIVFLSGEEFSQLHDAVTDHWKPMVEFLVASGARFGEVAACVPVMLTETRGRCASAGHSSALTPPGWCRAGSAENPNARCGPSTFQASVLDKLSYSAEWLFVNRDGNPVRIVGFRSRVWYPALDRAKLDPRPAVESVRGAVPVLPRARFPGPLAAPGVRVSTHRALHGSCRQAGLGIGQGVGIVLPR